MRLMTAAIKYLTPSAVAARWSTSRAFIYKLINDGRLRAVRLPGAGPRGRATVRVELSSVEELENGGVR